MPQKVPGFKFVKEAGGISEYRLLKNDLSVLVMEDHSSPTATLMVTYKVGSRNEAVGHTGSTHILEHLMFKGSKKFSPKKNTGLGCLETMGARLNATTWLDRTNYYETVPIGYLQLAIQIEADRMRNATFAQKDLAKEMTVVRNEFERVENDPTNLLDTEMWASAYLAHPYHHPTIGWREDIENATVEQLRKFYDTFYHPNNATVTVIGDFKSKEVLTWIKKYFGVHKRAKNIPNIHTVEPKQTGKRHVEISRAIEPNTLGISWKIPRALDRDTHAIQVLSSLLGSGKSSILYRKLVDHGFATSVQVSAFPTRDPGLFAIYVHLAPGVEHREVEKIVFDTIEELKRSVDKEAVLRAKKLLEAEIAFARDGSYAMSSYINEAIALGDWTFFVTFIEKISKVNPEDLRLVTQKYFVNENLTTGYFISKNI